LENDVVCVSPDVACNPNLAIPDAVLTNNSQFGMYTIYTSGSTGRPKGVVLQHKGVVNRLGWMKKNLIQVNKSRNDLKDIRELRALQKTSICFDVSVWELWLPIIEGGHMILLPQGQEKEPQAIAEHMQQYCITALHFVPSMLAAFLHQTTDTSFLADACAHVDYVIASGEGLPANIASLVPKISPFTSMLNYYGPTEATIDVSWHEYSEKTDQGLDTVQIGVPIDNTQLWVLDKQLNVVPVGVPGELYLGGCQLARAYHNRPDLTASKFMPNPVALHSNKGSRLYATGDLCKYNEDGEVEYLGRIDFQVKIRGFRIELGEIEALVRSNAGVREAVVIAKSLSGSGGDLKLVAYFTRTSSTTPVSVNDLRNFCSEKIPAYMVPTFFVGLEAFPTSANGKLERNLLPDPRQSLESERAFEEPTNPKEETLCKIWQQVLRSESPIGITDNFFELGGDSIVSIALVAKAKSVGLGMSIKMLFEYPTVRELAKHVTEVKVAGAQTSSNKPIVGPISPSPVQLWWQELRLENPNHFNQAQIIDVPKTVSPEKLQEASLEIVNHHDMLRLSMEGSTFTARPTLSSASECFAVIDLRAERDGTNVMKENATKFQASLDLAAGKAVQFVYYLLGDSHAQNKLFMVIHHIAVDGVSWNVIIEDINYLLEDSNNATKYRTHNKTLDFGSWNQLSKTYASSNSSEFGYWKEVLNKSATSLNIFDKLTEKTLPKGPEFTFGAVQNVFSELGVEDTNKLASQVSKKFFAQMNDILLTAFVIALVRWRKESSEGAKRISFTLEGHGRETSLAGSDVDVSQTVGWFTSMFPVSLEVPASLCFERVPSPSLGTLLLLVKEQLRCIPTNGAGFGSYRYLNETTRAELLREETACGSFLSGLICFNYLGRVQSDFFDEVVGDMVAPDNSVYRLLDVNGSINDGKLSFCFSYLPALFEKESMNDLASTFSSVLQDLVSYSELPSAGARSPSDFPLLVDRAHNRTLVTQEQLDTILKGQEADVVDIYPLTPMQEGMLFHAVKDHGSEMYVTQIMWNIDDLNFDSRLFKKCWQTVIDRHPIFRSYFYFMGGLDAPVQIVKREVDITPVWHEVLWTAEHGGDRSKLEKFLRDDRIHGFDPTVVPLQRFHVIRDEVEGVLHFVWTHHHLYLDGWSLAIASNEVWTLYGSQQTTSLPAVTPFRDYVDWYRQKDMDEAKEFWQERLRNISSLTPLPGATQTGLPSKTLCHNHRLPFTKDLMAASRRFGVTLHTLFEATWAITLSSYSREDFVVFGTTVSGRSIASQSVPGVEGVVGLCINTLPITVTTRPLDTIGEWLKAIQTTHVSAVQYEYTPLVKMTSWSSMPKGMPLFESLVVFENYPVSDSTLNEEVMSKVSMEAFEKANLPLSVNFGFENDEVVISIFYDVSKFTSEGIEVLATMIGTTLKSFHNLTPNSVVGSLVAWEEESRPRPLATPIDDFTDEYSGLLLHEIFEKQVQKRPDSIALIDGDDLITWRELNNRANQLARVLRDRFGIRPGDYVGAFFERCFALNTTLVALMKIGASYLCMDREWPSSRIGLVLETAHTNLVLTVSSLYDKVKFQIPGVSWILVDTLDIFSFPTTNLNMELSPELPLYTIFTSGSTGTPKGIVINMEVFVKRCRWLLECLNLMSSHHISLQTTTLAFDFSCYQLYAPFWTGNAAVLLPSHQEKELQVYFDYMAKYSLTTFGLVPSQLNAWMDTGSKEELQETCKNLENLVIGGEAIPQHLQKLWWDPYWGKLLHNCYGPTEVCMVSNVFNYRFAPTTSKFSIGPCCSIYDREEVVDQYMRKLDIGVPGELLICTSCLANGYLNAPAITAKAYIPDWISNKPGARLYSSGDLVMFYEDSSVAFINRIDFQVKIRGFRIELGEIESVLNSMPGVKQSVVLSVDVNNNKHLTAYYTCTADDLGREADEERIGQLIKATQLPKYMIPTFYVRLIHFPLNANGKIDRKQLPVPTLDTSNQVTGASYVAPQNPLEQLLCEVWRLVLGLPQIGNQDDFFELGGDSIKSIQIVSKASRSGIKLTVRDLFEHRTIAELAREVASRTASTQERQLSLAAPQKTCLSPIQHWFFSDLPQNPHHFNQAQLIALPDKHQSTTVQQLKEALVKITDAHEALRMLFVPQADEPLLVPTVQAHLDVNNILSIPSLDSSRSLAEQAEILTTICNDLQSSLNITEGPIMRAAYLKHAQGVSLFFAIHHAVVDGISWRVFFEDLDIALDQLHEGKQISLPPSTHSFNTWTNQLVLHAPSSQILEEKPFWLDVLQRSRKCLEGIQVEAVPYQQFQEMKVTFSEEETKAVNEVCQLFRAQVNDVLLTAFAVALRTWTSADSVAFMLEGHGREDIIEGIDVSHTIGWFTSMFPVCLSLDGVDNPEENLIETLKSIKEQLRRIPNKGIGYGIMRYLNSEVRKELEPVLAGEKKASAFTFNFLGTFTQDLSGESSIGECVDPQNTSTHSLDANGLIVNGKLEFNFSFPPSTSEKAKLVAEKFAQSLRALVTAAQASEGGFTPSDFPLLSLSQKQLDLLCKDRAQLIDSIYRLTPMQEGMLFHSLRDPDEEQYTTQLRWTMKKSALDFPKFKKAWLDVMGAHDIFRTVFDWGLDFPVQLVVKSFDHNQFWFERKMKKDELEEFLKQDRRAGFNFKEPPLKFYLIELTDEQKDDHYEFVWSHHHVLLDGWSLGLVLNQFFEEYYDQKSSAPKPRKYKEYVNWLRSQDTEASKKYWYELLGDFDTPTRLPGAIAVPISSEETNAMHLTHIPPNVTSTLTNFCKANGLTMNTLLQGAWALVLSCYSRETDVLFGTTVSGRTAANIDGIEKMVGLMINTIPVRVKMENDKTVIDWLKGLQNQQTQSTGFEYSHLVDVQACSAIPKGTNFFDSILIYENFPFDDLSEKDDLISDVNSHECTGIPITLIIIKDNDKLEVKFLFDPSRVDRTVVENLHRYIEFSLVQIVEKANETLMHITLAKEEELEEVKRWNNTAQTYNPTDIPSLIMKQVEETPDAIALVIEDENITYRTLNDRSNILANYLLSMNVKMGDIVCVCMDRSVELLVSLLAIIKIGATYLPLDPTYPADRVALILEDSCPVVVLSHKDYLLAIHNNISVPDKWNFISSLASDTFTAPPLHLEGIMYMIYTSGSTGRPKAVQVPYKGAYNRLEWMKRHIEESLNLRDCKTQRIMQKTSIAFDVSVWELWLPLMTGMTYLISITLKFFWFLSFLITLVPYFSFPPPSCAYPSQEEPKCYCPKDLKKMWSPCSAKSPRAISPRATSYPLS
jgi:amino acid adenylation domain-containing protein/non-ribosomal peptide synthase protein (TIGR01720 family)